MYIFCLYKYSYINTVVKNYYCIEADSTGDFDAQILYLYMYVYCICIEYKSIYSVNSDSATKRRSIICARHYLSFVASRTLWLGIFL